MHRLHDTDLKPWLAWLLQLFVAAEAFKADLSGWTLPPDFVLLQRNLTCSKLSIRHASRVSQLSVELMHNCRSGCFQKRSEPGHVHLQLRERKSTFQTQNPPCKTCARSQAQPRGLVEVWRWT